MKVRDDDAQRFMNEYYDEEFAKEKTPSDIGTRIAILVVSAALVASVLYWIGKMIHT